MTAPRPVMFRAGGGPGEEPLASAAVTLTQGPAAPKVLLADISEFQPDITDAAYLAWSQAVIIRAAYGDQHDDRAWFGGQRRDLLHAGGVRFLGIYQYIVATQDPAAQAAALVRLVGALRPGEKIIADIEEGSGDLRETWRIWSAEVTGALGDHPWDYSGLNFAAAHGLAPVDWVAAYQGAEPAVANTLWQFTDAFTVPGVGTCDCSVFRGTIDQLAALAHGGSTTAPAVNWTEIMISNLPTLGQGDTDQPGAVRYVHRIQNGVAGIGRWNGLGPVTAITDDGAFGPATTAAVKAVQGFFGLVQDGVVGKQTWLALIAGQHS